MTVPTAPPCSPSFRSEPPPYQNYPCCRAWGHQDDQGKNRWREWLNIEGNAASPVIDQNTQQRYHQALDFKLIKSLKEAATTYGPQAAFTVSLVESVASLNLTPDDWANVARAALSGGQYLTFKTAWQEFSQDTAQRNIAAGNNQWNLDMLMDTGQYLGQHHQVKFPPAVYQQIATAAVRAWKTLQGSGDLQGQLSKVLQGPNEPYANFLARLMQTAGRIFGDAETAMPLVKQLAYEQANKWCREAIRPWKN